MSETPTMADVSDIDLKALIMTWEKNPNLLGFRDAVLSCLTELQARRAAEAKAVEALRELNGRIDDMWNDKTAPRPGDIHEIAICQAQQMAAKALGARND